MKQVKTILASFLALGALTAVGFPASAEASEGHHLNGDMVTNWPPKPPSSAIFGPTPPMASDANTTVHRIYLANVSNKPTGVSSAKIRSAIQKASAYWERESKGRVDFILAAEGEFDYSGADDPGSLCGMKDPARMWEEASKELYPTVDFRTSAANHLLIPLPRNCAPNGPLAMGSIGHGLNSGGGVIFAADPPSMERTLAHEFGHNFGLYHADEETRPNSIHEYMNLYSVMGINIKGMGIPALDSAWKSQLGINGGDSRTVAPTAAKRTYTIVAQGNARGIQALAIKDKACACTWHVEYRNGAGHDKGAGYAKPGRWWITRDDLKFMYGKGVTINRVDHKPKAYKPSRISWRSTTLTPSRVAKGKVRAPWAAGSTFHRHRTYISIDRITSGSATVSVRSKRFTFPSQKVRIKGAMKVGRRVKVSKSKPWPAGTKVTYRWMSNGKPIKGATKSSYRIPKKMKKKKLSVKMVAKKDNYTKRVYRTPKRKVS